MTKGALAAAVGLSPRSLSKYEHEGLEPTPLNIAKLADALDFPVGFFHGETLDEPSPEHSSFRSLSTLTARQRDQALASGGLAFALSDWIEDRFELPEPDVPQYPELDPETAAEAIREKWELGNRTIGNMVHLLEAHGVRVLSLVEENREVDAFSCWRRGRPYVFLNTQKNVEHGRMDAAHELGHLVLHAHGGPQGRQQEHEAYAFAAAFLMPQATVIAELPRAATLGQLVRHKSRWKVSALALARRANRLGLLTDWQYRSVCIALSKRGKANEPRALKRPETSQILEKVFRALRAESMSPVAIARTLQVPTEEINKSVFGLVLTQIEGNGTAPSKREGKGHLSLVKNP